MRRQAAGSGAAAAAINPTIPHECQGNGTNQNQSNGTNQIQGNGTNQTQGQPDGERSLIVNDLLEILMKDSVSLGGKTTIQADVADLRTNVKTRMKDFYKADFAKFEASPSHINTLCTVDQVVFRRYQSMEKYFQGLPAKEPWFNPSIPHHKRQNADRLLSILEKFDVEGKVYYQDDVSESYMEAKDNMKFIYGKHFAKFEKNPFHLNTLNWLKSEDREIFEAYQKVDTFFKSLKVRGAEGLSPWWIPVGIAFVGIVAYLAF